MAGGSTYYLRQLDAADGADEVVVAEPMPIEGRTEPRAAAAAAAAPDASPPAAAAPTAVDPLVFLDAELLEGLADGLESDYEEDI
eukprot:SAG31_NODE_3225_length_4519_cov_2.363122_3_plen_85_part_00